MRFWSRWIATPLKRDLTEKRQCAKDVALAASFVRSLETGDREVNMELRQLAGDLERIAGRLQSVSPARAA